MGFLKRFFRNVFREGEMPTGTSSFERLSEEGGEDGEETPAADA